jgi:hypothetical protein
MPAPWSNLISVVILWFRTSFLYCSGCEPISATARPFHNGAMKRKSLLLALAGPHRGWVRRGVHAPSRSEQNYFDVAAKRIILVRVCDQIGPCAGYDVTEELIVDHRADQPTRRQAISALAA